MALALSTSQAPLSGMMAALLTMAEPDDRDKTANDSPNLEAESSFDLIHRAHAGDGRARDVLFARYYKRLQGWAHGRLPEYARGAIDTFDLVQDTMIQVFKNFDTFEPRHTGAFLAFVRTTLKHKIVDRIRQARVRPSGGPLDSEHPASDASPAEQYFATELLERYEAALERLRPSDREAVILRVELHLPWSELAEALGKPTNAAAQMAVRRALVRLAKEMERLPES